MSSIDYKKIFEKGEVGIALNDPETGTIGTVNDRYATLMGYSPGELQDKQIEEISAEDPSFNQSAAFEKIQRALEGERQQFDWLFERKDGSRFWGEVVLKRTEIGPKDRLLAFVRDISERKRYERELEQKNRRLDDFASVVSHDLINPLNVAEGRLELAREECDSEHLDDVARAHARIETLIEDLLALAKAGEPIGDLEPIDLATLAGRCWERFTLESATLHNDVETTVSADPSRLQQLITNLMRNAIDHGGEDVTITVGESPTGFYVEDDGPGIPEDEREDVFESGYTTSPEGMGFGLAIVKQVVDAHGWNIRIEAGSTGGAKFVIGDVARSGDPID
jgi:PAS domain S-box-containing protein